MSRVLVRLILTLPLAAAQILAAGSTPAAAQSSAALDTESADSLASRHPTREPQHVTRLILDTVEGTIDIELFEAAAPATVQRLKRLVEGPIFNPSLVPPAEDGATVGFYDGLVFGFTRPHIEIVTSTREPSSSFIFPNELDAEALGLDEQLISDPAEAMTILQRELLVVYRERKKSSSIPEQLKSLLDQWSASYTPDFLIGVSRKEINEALGYAYQKGLESRPTVKGSVLLTPISPTHSSARLSILLEDIPQRTGRWMVIGRVTHGLEVAEAISARPRVRDRREEFRPLNPVVIERASLIRVPVDDGAQ